MALMYNLQTINLTKYRSNLVIYLLQNKIYV